MDVLKDSERSLRTKAYASVITTLYDDDVYEKWAAICESVGMDRRSKARKFRNESDRVRCIAAGALLYEAYKDYTGETAIPRIETSIKGKPFFVTGPIKFNLSHSGDYVMCVLSDEEVGCDVENHNANAENIAKRFFSLDEFEYIRASGGKDEAFTRLWTLKESVLKAFGTGLAYPLDGFAVVQDGVIAKTIMFGDELCEYYLKSFPRVDSYCFSVCSRNPLIDDELIMIDIK